MHTRIETVFVQLMGSFNDFLFLRIFGSDSVDSVRFWCISLCLQLGQTNFKLAFKELTTQAKSESIFLELSKCKLAVLTTKFCTFPNQWKPRDSCYTWFLVAAMAVPGDTRV
jgi:hypothetical protein